MFDEPKLDGLFGGAAAVAFAVFLTVLTLDRSHQEVQAAGRLLALAVPLTSTAYIFVVVARMSDSDAFRLALLIPAILLFVVGFMVVMTAVGHLFAYLSPDSGSFYRRIVGIVNYVLTVVFAIDITLSVRSWRKKRTENRGAAA